MRWTDLAFLHWSVPVDALRPLIPAELELDLFEGRAWIGVVPFQMKDVRVRYGAPVPTATNFAELNVRTYVRSPKRAGVWFFSLDASSWVAAQSARIGLNLPYCLAQMTVLPTGDRVEYKSERTQEGMPAANFQGAYGLAGPALALEPGTLDHWLIERYCLFGQRSSGALYQLEIHHAPWTVHPGVAEIDSNSMISAAGIAQPDIAPLVHIASEQEVLAWGPRAI